MKTRLIIATCLIILAAFVHTIGGELINISALLQSNIADNLKIEIRASWYLVGIDFFISGFYMLYFLLRKSISEHKALIQFIGIRMLVYGLLFLILILSTNSAVLFQVPQWILLISTGLLLNWPKFQIKHK